MKITFSIAAVITICLSLTFSLPVLADKGDKSDPVEKATACAGSDHPWYDSIYWEFDAHEEGEVDGVSVGKGTMRNWNTSTGTEMSFEVGYVDVEDDRAWFAARCTYDSRWPNPNKVGHWVYVEVKDGGEPGIGVDEIGWRWGTGTEQEAKDQVMAHASTSPHYDGIDEGNIQVHTR